MFDVNQIRKDFPILQRTNQSGNQLVYLDNAATTQKPNSVIDTISDFYKNYNANIHRGIHFLGVEATALYEATREKVRAFIGANNTKEIIFVRGTTEGINLVATSLGNKIINEGDRILVTGMEHHSNLIPWQQLTKSKKATLDIVSVSSTGEISLDEVSSKITDQTKLLALTHISNSLGTLNPLKEVIELAHSKGVPVLVDGAQTVAHQPVDVKSLDCDFYAFSAHKMYGPTGVGVLYAKEEFLAQMTPYQFGGEMIQSVDYQNASFAELPHKFEAGTPDIAGVIGMGAAIDYIQSVGFTAIQNHSKDLTQYMVDQLTGIEGLRIIGNPEKRSSIASFIFDQVHPHDVATILDEHGVAVRAGHHCTMPLMRSFNIPGTTRASVAIYNTKDEIDQLAKALETVKTIFG